MKVATIRIDNPKTQLESRDGALVVVSHDAKRLAKVPNSEYPSLARALEQWDDALVRLQDIFSQLELGKWQDTLASESVSFMAPLPRTYAWLDGSAFIQHIILVRKARGAEPPETLETVPLMYQGISDTLKGPNDDILAIDEAHGIDFEAEVGVVLSDVPMATKAADAAQYIKLIVLMNDVSLRNLIPAELAAGFGFFHGKPSTSFAPFAITPDELGSAWRDTKVHLPLVSILNDKPFGEPNAGEMHFSFAQLIEHAAKTRALSAGTIIGSGTVSNRDESVGSSCLAEKRMLEKIHAGEIQTPFMKFGDRIELEMFKDGKSLFGRIDQRVAKYQG